MRNGEKKGMMRMLLWLCLALQVGCGGRSPALSEVRISAVTPSQATVEWSTNKPSDSEVGFAVSPSTTYTFTTCCQRTRTVAHVVTVDGLTAATNYNFIVQSSDGATHLTSDVGQFTTAAAPVDPQGGATPPRRRAGTVHAFPEAQGGGAASVGGSGRGGGSPQVYEVTTLSDRGGSCSGHLCSGSLRFCLEGAGPRTCVFRVSGLITFLSRMQISSPFLTVAGQTAPGGGIVVGGPNQKGEQIFVTTHDVVIRYLTYDGNNPNLPTGPSTGTVGFSTTSGNIYNVVYDHLSARWWGNKAFPLLSNDVGNVHNVTYQWTLGYEPNVNHPVSGLGTDATAGSALATTDIDFHHNMIVNIDHRAPLLQGANRVRWVNNLTYNWNQFAFLSMGGLNVDIIGNKYVDGNLSEDFVHVFLGNGNGADPKDPTDNCSGGNPCDNSGPPTWYLLNNTGRSGNKPGSAPTVPTNVVNDAGEVNMTQQGSESGETRDPNSKGPIPSSWLRSTPLPAETFPITPDPVTSLESVLLATVGNSQHLDCYGNWLNNRDSQDTRIINQYQSRGKGGLFTGQFSAPSIPGGTPCVSSLHDGIPDAWKKAHGYSLTDAGLGSRAARNGYTYLENYLNGTDPDLPESPR
jgi:hypothetical protein